MGISGHLECTTDLELRSTKHDRRGSALSRAVRQGRVAVGLQGWRLPGIYSVEVDHVLARKSLSWSACNHSAPLCNCPTVCDFALWYFGRE